MGMGSGSFSGGSIYIYMYVYVCIYIYIYMFLCLTSPPAPWLRARPLFVSGPPTPEFWMSFVVCVVLGVGEGLHHA